MGGKTHGVSQALYYLITTGHLGLSFSIFPEPIALSRTRFRSELDSQLKQAKAISLT